MRTALVALALAVVAAWLALPAGPALWGPFEAAETLQVVHLGGDTVASNLQAGAGRIRAFKPVELVFRRSAGASEIALLDPEGDLRAFLGDAGPALELRGGALWLEAGGAPEELPLPDGLPSATLALRCRDGTCAVLAGSRVLAERPWTGARPDGRVGVRLSAGASLRELALSGDDGPQVVRPDGREEGWLLPALAALAALFLVPALAAWWRLVVHRGAVRRGDALLGAAAGLLLAAGPAVTLHAANRERMRPPAKPCAVEPVERLDADPVAPLSPLTIPGRIDGDFVLDAEVVLAPQTVLDCVVRGSDPTRDLGVVVTLSSDPRLASSLALNLSVAWQGQDAPASLRTLPAGRPLALRIEAQGPRVRALVDGEELGEVSDHDLRAGHTTLLALSGEARIPRLVLQPGGQPGDLGADLVRWMAAVAGVLLLALGLLALLVRPRGAALLSVAPLALAGWPWVPLPAAVACAAATLVLALASARNRRLPALLPCAALLAAAAWARLERPPDLSPLLLNKLRPADCRGPALPEAYAWARHPLLRRFNGFVRTQTFRSGPAAPEPAAGTRRVIALGSSSTFGYGVGAGETWSAQLAQLLGPGFEVINAGVPGSTAERLRLYLQGALLRLQPDIVIVSLTFNDRSMGPGGDERAWVSELLGDGISLAEQWLMRWRTERAVDEWVRTAAALKAGDSLDPAQRESCLAAPARFGDSLRDLALASREAGATVVLVCEPVQRGEDLPLLDEYREAIRGVARELGLAVIEPQAALDVLEGRGFLDAVHPSRMGHRVVAREIAAGLRQAGLGGASR